MKKLYTLFAIMAMVILPACSSTQDNNEVNYRYSNENERNDVVKNRETCPNAQRSVQYQATQPMQSCGGCQAKEYTVRRPVKVVYQNTTYRTVYEPRTYQTTTYETRPYNQAEACSGGNCVMGASMMAQPVVDEQVSVNNEVIGK